MEQSMTNEVRALNDVLADLLKDLKIAVSQVNLNQLTDKNKTGWINTEMKSKDGEVYEVPTQISIKPSALNALKASDEFKQLMENPEQKPSQKLKNTLKDSILKFFAAKDNNHENLYISDGVKNALNAKQLKDLQEKGQLDQPVEIEFNGKKNNYLIGVDPDTAKLNLTNINSISVPNSYKNHEFSDKEKEDVKNGKTVVFNVTNTVGDKEYSNDYTISFNPKTAKLYIESQYFAAPQFISLANEFENQKYIQFEFNDGKKMAVAFPVFSENNDLPTGKTFEQMLNQSSIEDKDQIKSIATISKSDYDNSLNKYVFYAGKNKEDFYSAPKFYARRNEMETMDQSVKNQAWVVDQELVLKTYPKATMYINNGLYILNSNEKENKVLASAKDADPNIALTAPKIWTKAANVIRNQKETQTNSEGETVGKKASKKVDSTEKKNQMNPVSKQTKITKTKQQQHKMSARI